MFIGAVLGLMLYQWWGKKWIVPIAAFGAILPDIIDKPLGHLLLSGTLDSGRIYGHTLLFFAVLFAVGLLLWRYKRSIALAVVGVGLGSHLVLDSMWNLPVSLFWPILGPFQQYHYPDYFATSLVTELTSPSEWIFGLLLVTIICTIYRDDLGKFGSWAVKNLSPLQQPMQAFLVIIGLFSLVSGVLTALVDFVSGENMVIVGICAVLGGGYLIYREMPQNKDAPTS
jgi:membrane-bound metal-dependent hydrolase YbcI (DUF457 family)